MVLHFVSISTCNKYNYRNPKVKNTFINIQLKTCDMLCIKFMIHVCNVSLVLGSVQDVASYGLQVLSRALSF